MLRAGVGGTQLRPLLLAKANLDPKHFWEGGWNAGGTGWKVLGSARTIQKGVENVIIGASASRSKCKPQDRGTER